MKFLSLFTKSPTHQRFNYAPRYYDPKQEERTEREQRIRRELGMDARDDAADHKSRIAGAFHAARRYRPDKESDRTSNFIRFGILAALTLLLIAYLTWGSNALYALLLLIPGYAYLKFKRK